MSFIRHLEFYSLHAQAGFVHERTVAFSTTRFQHLDYSTESGGKCRI